eukprot:scaffold13163_cov98-Isochrysis_galbana.AAC.5
MPAESRRAGALSSAAPSGCARTPADTVQHAAPARAPHLHMPTRVRPAAGSRAQQPMSMPCRHSP